MAQGAERLLDELQLPPRREVLLLPKKLLDQALATETPQPIAALVEPPSWTWAHVLGQNQQKTLVHACSCRHSGPRQPGHDSALRRGIRRNGIVSLPGTVSAWNPKAVRASAGSVFRVPVLAASVDECFARLREAGVKFLPPPRAPPSPPTLRRSRPGQSLSSSATKATACRGDLPRQADGAITIPCPGPVESLNAAVAASVLLYEARGSARASLPATRSTPPKSQTAERGTRMSLFDERARASTCSPPKVCSMQWKWAERRWRSACGRAAWTSWSARSIWSAPASRCACRSSATMPAP